MHVTPCACLCLLLLFHFYHVLTALHFFNVILHHNEKLMGRKGDWKETSTNILFCFTDHPHNLLLLPVPT